MEVAAASFEGGEALVGEVGYLASHLQDSLNALTDEAMNVPMAEDPDEKDFEDLVNRMGMIEQENKETAFVVRIDAPHHAVDDHVLRPDPVKDQELRCRDVIEEFQVEIEGSAKNRKEERNGPEIKDEKEETVPECSKVDTGGNGKSKMQRPRFWKTPASWKSREALMDCEHCGAQRKGGSMRVHFMLNHQWGNFKCDRCHYFAFYSTDFAYHVLTVHSGGNDGKKVTATCPECEIAVPMESDVTAFVDHYQDCMNAWRKLLLKDSKDKIRSKNTTRKRTAPLDIGRNRKVGGKADALARRREVTQPLRVKCYHDVAKSPQFKSEDVNEKDIELERGMGETDSEPQIPESGAKLVQVKAEDDCKAECIDDAAKVYDFDDEAVESFDQMEETRTSRKLSPPSNSYLECPYPKCGKRLSNLRSLKNHYANQHERAKGYPCPHGCPNKTLKTEAYLRYHTKCYHSGVPKRYECPQCPLVFAKAHRMRYHLNTIHYPNKFRCRFCHMSFADSSSLKRHGLVHQDTGDFPCNVCGKVLKKRDSLRDHKRTHTGEKPFFCRYCPYRGSSSSLLAHHKHQRHKAEFLEEKSKKAKAREASMLG